MASFWMQGDFQCLQPSFVVYLDTYQNNHFHLKAV